MLSEYIGSTYSNSGLWFTIRNFWAFNWESGIFVLALCAMLYLWKKGKENHANIFFYIYAVLFLCAMNPILMMGVTEIVESSTQVRFYWMIPYHVIIGVALLCVLDSLKSKKKRILLLGIAILGLWIIGDDTLLIQHKLPENIYYCPEEVIQISKILHEETQNEQVVSLIVHSDYKAYMRQYDPSIIIPVEYSCMNDFLFSNAEIDSMVKEGNCEFLVMPMYYLLDTPFEEPGYSVICKTEQCIIYRVNSE